ncbi:hypothetical protein TYRP_001906 [Tyrophagus putrescentiae]|nr:hypothetical protein TYRP_001906 [Tyrophagus putrescentiae]
MLAESMPKRSMMTANSISFLPSIIRMAEMASGASKVTRGELSSSLLVSPAKRPMRSFTRVLRTLMAVLEMELGGRIGLTLTLSAGDSDALCRGACIVEDGGVVGVFAWSFSLGPHQVHWSD